MSNRFDPIPDADYGHCLNCDEKFQTQAQADAHMTATLEACPPDDRGNSRGHSVRVGNPPRDRRISHAVQEEIDYALQDFFSIVDGWILSKHLTEEEAKAAMSNISVDIADEWEEYQNG